MDTMVLMHVDEDQIDLILSTARSMETFLQQFLQEGMLKAFTRRHAIEVPEREPLELMHVADKITETVAIIERNKIIVASVANTPGLGGAVNMINTRS